MEGAGALKLAPPSALHRRQQRLERGDRLAQVRHPAMIAQVLRELGDGSFQLRPRSFDLLPKRGNIGPGSILSICGHRNQERGFALQILDADRDLGDRFSHLSALDHADGRRAPQGALIIEERHFCRGGVLHGTSNRVWLGFGQAWGAQSGGSV